MSFKIKSEVADSVAKITLEGSLDSASAPIAKTT